MAEGIPARLSPAQLRKFGLTVGAAFLALAGLMAWRSKGTAALLCAAVGGLLVLAGAVAPGRLGPVYRAWMGLAQALSRITTPIFLAIVYFLVLAPIGGIMRALGRNPVRRPLADGGFWVRRDNRRSDLHHQF